MGFVLNFAMWIRALVGQMHRGLKSRMAQLITVQTALSYAARLVLALTTATASLTLSNDYTMSAFAAQPAATSSQSDSGVVLRLKGSDFSVTGSVTSFDGRTYIVETRNFGTVEIDAQKFDCLGQQCPSAPFTANPSEPPKPLAANAPIPPAIPTPVPSAQPADQVAAPLITSPATGPEGVPTRNGRRVVISGSQFIGERLMPELIEAFAASTGARMTRGATAPESAKFILTLGGTGEAVEFDVRTQGNDQGFRDLERGTSQIVMSTRAIEGDEATRLATRGLGNFRLPSHEHVLALDGLMVFVASRNPAVALSIEQLAKILAGEITDWSQVNLPPGPINVYAAQPLVEGPDTLTTLLLQPRGLKLAATTQRTRTNAELAERIASDPAGIAIGAVAQRPSTKALTIGTSCGLIVKPSMFAVKTEEYPLSRLLYLYTAGDPPDPAARALMTFVMSAAAQPIIRRLDFVDQEVQTLSFSDQTDRLAYALNAAPEDFDLKLARTMISELRNGQRLSLTFRFQSNTDQLSAKSIADMNLLIAHLAARDNLAKRAQLVGFADTSGTFPTNLRLSERRTANVYNTLLALAQGKIDPARITARSYGKLAPVACNDSNTHRGLNRRVEVWLQN